LAVELVERGRRVLHLLIKETAIFVAGVQVAEAHPEAAISLATTCLELVSEATEKLSTLEEKDPNLERACEELRAARDIFRSIVVGEPPHVAEKFITNGIGGWSVLALDMAHSHTHRAIDLLTDSKNIEAHRELLELLSKARRDSSPTTLYRLSYEMARSK
jgi:hypothetical protein